MTVTPILTRALRYGAVVAAAVAILGGGVGYLVAGVPGLLGGLLGAAFAAVFLALTAVSMLIAGRVTHGDGTSPLFYGIILLVSVLKFVAFIAATQLLREQTWMDARVFVVAIIVAVVGSLIADALAISRARVPYVSDVVLPGEPDPKP